MGGTPGTNEPAGEGYAMKRLGVRKANGGGGLNLEAGAVLAITPGKVAGRAVLHVRSGWRRGRDGRGSRVVQVEVHGDAAKLRTRLKAVLKAE